MAETSIWWVYHPYHSQTFIKPYPSKLLTQVAARVAQTYTVKHGRLRAQGSPSEPYLQSSSELPNIQEFSRVLIVNPILPKSGIQENSQGPTIIQSFRLGINRTFNHMAPSGEIFRTNGSYPNNSLVRHEFQINGIFSNEWPHRA